MGLVSLHIRHGRHHLLPQAQQVVYTVRCKLPHLLQNKHPILVKLSLSKSLVLLLSTFTNFIFNVRLDINSSVAGLSPHLLIGSVWSSKLSNASNAIWSCPTPNYNILYLTVISVKKVHLYNPPLQIKHNCSYSILMKILTLRLVTVNSAIRLISSG